MFKKMCLGAVVCLCVLNLTGCLALLAGGAAGAGTAKWLSDKLVQQVNTPYDKAVEAARSGLNALNLEVTKENSTPKVTQLRSKNAEGKEVFVDIFNVAANASRYEVRVGMVSGQEEARKILNSIEQYLPAGSTP